MRVSIGKLSDTLQDETLRCAQNDATAKPMRCGSAREAYFFQLLVVARVVAEALHQRASFYFRGAGVALANGAFEPLEGRIRFAAVGVDFGDLIGTIVLVRGDQILQ